MSTLTTATNTTTRPPRPRAGELATVTPIPGPPVDGEGRVALAATQGALALDLAPRPLPQPEVPELRLVPTADPARIRPWAARFAQAVVEVLSGDRSVTQLIRWTDEEVYGQLHRRADLLRRIGGVPSLRVRPQVRSVHVMCPDDAVAEVSVHVRHGARSRCMAARLERHRDHWRCVALELG